MKVISERKRQTKFDNYNATCPYNGIDICHASISLMSIDNKKKEDYCCDENYDNCPIFLAKMLRMITNNPSLKSETNYGF